MERTVLEEFWRRNGPVGPSLEVIYDDEFVRKVNSV
jgi:alanyl-tRNA synthetase